MDSPTLGFTFGMRLGDVREGLGLSKSAMVKSLCQKEHRAEKQRRFFLIRLWGLIRIY